MITEDRHRGLLREVIVFGPSFAEATFQLRGLGFDGRQDVARLTVSDAVDVLRRTLEERMSDADLTLWADTIEGREDVELDPSAADSMSDLLFDLSNPAINGRDRRKLAHWVHRLSAHEETA